MYGRLVELVGKIAWEENRRFEGQEIEVMFALGEGRKDSETNRMSGRARDNRLVHVAVGEEPSDRLRPGDIAYATITHAAPHHLNSDAPLRGLRRTRGGDAGPAALLDAAGADEPDVSVADRQEAQIGRAHV